MYTCLSRINSLPRWLCQCVIVPTLRVGMLARTLRVDVDAERQSLRYHAERGNDHYILERGPEQTLNPNPNPQKQKRPEPVGAFQRYTTTSNQCETAPLAPRPVCERTNCGKNNARSPSAAFDLSVTEKNQMPTNAMAIENSAGYSYGKIAFS